MKKYEMIRVIKVFNILTFILIITSCEDFLTEKPRNRIATTQYFLNESDARSSVNSLYYVGVPTFYASGGWTGSHMMLTGYTSGFMDNERAEGVGPLEAQHLTMNPDNINMQMREWWTQCYTAIARANYSIKNILGLDLISESVANQLLGEAKFFRALNYFFLVKAFGDVPIITEPYESLDNIFVKRDPAGEVYKLITDDLEWVLANAGLPDVPYYKNGYKVTKGSAATLLADVYLQNAGYPVLAAGSYAKAATAARTVINSGVYKLIQNGTTPEQSAYNVMRTSEKELEYIYAIEFNADLRTNGLPRYCIPKYASPQGCKLGDVWNAYRPLDEFVRIYDPILDLRIQNKQLWHNKIERNGVIYDFLGRWAAYLWFDETAIYETALGGRDVTVYRYAEVLLIAAEAIAQSEGVTSEAVSYLADVRARAYWQTNKNDIVTELQGLSKDQFIEEVWKERHRELVFNFKTWPDIQRTRKYPVTSESNPGEVQFVDVIGHTNPWGAIFQERHLLYPMSRLVIQVNPELTQNPGY